MNVYFDSCAIQRPLDVFTVLRNKLEAEAVLGIIGYCEAGTLALVSSEAAVTLVRRGIKPMDAVHIALAESAGVDYFCSCDDRLLRRLKRIKDLQIKPRSPLELIEELET